MFGESQNSILFAKKGNFIQCILLLTKWNKIMFAVL